MKMFQTNAGISQTNYLVIKKFEVKGYEDEIFLNSPQFYNILKECKLFVNLLERHNTLWRGLYYGEIDFTPSR